MIEAEASRTLTEMRTMVKVLRDVDAVDYAPQRGIGDLDELTRMSPLVQVRCVGDLADLAQPVEVTVYRICQESVTNAIRHAVHPTNVSVEVRGEASVVEGACARRRRRSPARDEHGLRPARDGRAARLLGGACRAGPDPAGGWTVEATLPREVLR